jgi:glucose-1-phosphate cytidylyltransferase
MKVVILAGGLGTRLSEETGVKPKPMVEVGGRPLIWHIMKHYAQHGFNEFIIALGYKGEAIKNYFLNYHHSASDVSIDVATRQIEVIRSSSDDWKIHLIDTGLNTLTGGRLLRLKEFLLSPNESFMLTYGDGLSNIDLTKLLSFHVAQKTLATVTAVRPPARFGSINFEDNLISDFAEKTQTSEGWINGGFMVLEPQIFEYLNADQDILEVDLLEKLASDRQLMGYKHEGFWQCMDTLRDKSLLERLWEEGSPPWRSWL